MMEISRSISIFTNEQTNGQSICVSELFRWSSICEGETKFEEVLQSEFGIGKGSLSDDECEGKRTHSSPSHHLLIKTKLCLVYLMVFKLISNNYLSSSFQHVFFTLFLHKPNDHHHSSLFLVSRKEIYKFLSPVCIVYALNTIKMPAASQAKPVTKTKTTIICNYHV